MNVLAIPKKLTASGDLVILPRREYEALLGLKKIKTFKATPAVKRALRRAERNFLQGKTLTFNDLVRKLAA